MYSLGYTANYTIFKQSCNSENLAKFKVSGKIGVMIIKVEKKLWGILIPEIYDILKIQAPIDAIATLTTAAEFEKVFLLLSLMQSIKKNILLLLLLCIILTLTQL